MSKNDEIRKLKEKIEELEFVKDFQQDIIADMELITGVDMSKKSLPKTLAEEIERKKKDRIKENGSMDVLGSVSKPSTNGSKPNKDVVAHLRKILELIDKDIENWIKPYATIVGNKNDVDINLREKNPTEYFLRLTLPDNFQEYAIALHSFWINNRIPKEKVMVRELSNEEYPEDDFSRISWSDFHERKNREFDLNKAIMESIEHTHPYDKQLNNELYPGEGLMDKEHLMSLVKIVNELYGNQEIELFYTFLATKNWEKDLVYSGKISTLPKLFEEENLRLTPSLIYPKNKNWVVNTDYDLSFSTIGGEAKLISELTKRNPNGILKIKR